MKRFFLGFALLFLAAVPAAAQASVEGRWTNMKRSVVIEVARCGQAWCATVVSASAKAKANARKGGTENLIGTRILTGARPVGNGVYKGRGFIPKRNIYAPATIRQLGPNVMEVEGCALAGLLCKEQRWTRVG
ncbi:DUF2147 domain-containing protein [Sphingomonas sp.]|uniref:DUF2147 domain-containing protein n=1 Tax=Sphingomonas sp. TaxID=28214 RepID=UPI0017A14B37|nr:DUF2147 domain-containing protein [Sphingomonas sp.]MBA3511866.1 DUF2147 domain-containing protein [Sphingomonas sp.]